MMVPLPPEPASPLPMASPRPAPSPAAGPLQALLWDVDGTLAETELEGHRRAFNQAFAEEGLPWHWDPATYLRLLAVSGGKERLSRFLTDVEGKVPSEDRLVRLQSRKQVHYGDLMRAGALPLRPGVARLVREAAAAGLDQAIVTTSGRAAVEALCQGMAADLRACFRFWICGEDVSRKKPDPEAYQLAIDRLGTAPAAILAIEDSRNGLLAATGAGLACLVTLSASSRHEAEAASAAVPAAPERGADPFDRALAVLDGLGAPDLPAHPHRGPGCPAGQVTLSWLQDLIAAP